MQACSLSCVGTGISIQSSGVKSVLWDQWLFLASIVQIGTVVLWSFVMWVKNQLQYYLTKHDKYALIKISV